jgi:hypothetical protein
MMVTFRPNIVPKAPSSVTTLEIRAYKEDIERYLNSQSLSYPASSRTVTNCSVKLNIVSYLWLTACRSPLCSSWSDSSNSLSRFLLAQLYINSLTDDLREKEIDIMLDNMQNGEGGLNKAYNDTANRIENQQRGFRDLAKRVLL